jgi:hypothetical protein
MKNKHVGFLVVAIAIVFFLIVMSFNNALESIVNTSCTHGVSCPMGVTLRNQKMVSYGLIALLATVGIIISYFLKDEQIRIIHRQSSKENVVKTSVAEEKKFENLDEEERRIMNIVQREDGSVYQSDIIKETKLTKVKVTRILDKLEGKSLIERKRRGMTNIIIAR